MSQPGYPTSTPGPTGGAAPLAPSPLDLGQTLSGAFRVMKARLAQLIVLALLPIGIGMVLVVGASVPLVIGLVQAVSEQRFSPLIVLGMFLLFASMVIAALLNVKAQGMMALAAHDSATGRGETGLADLSARTRGLVGRVLLFYLLVFAAVLVVYAIIIGIVLAAAFNAARSDGGDSAIAAVLGVMLLVMLLVSALAVVAFYLQIRFLYFIPVLAVEGTSAIDSLRRSWRLTKNNVLRTLGYYLVASLIVSAANGAVSMFGQLFAGAAMPAGQSNSSDPGAALAALGAALPVLIITMLLSMLVSLLAVPFLTCVLTVMYTDQVRRDQLPGGGRGSYGTAYAAPAAGYPNQAQGYGQGWQQQQPGWGQQPPQQQPGWGQQPPQQPGGQQGWNQPPPYQG